jgi:YbbR domain-containing protein
MDVSVKNVTVEIVSATTVEFPINIEYTEKPNDEAVPLVENMSVSTATVVASDDKLAEIDRVAAVIDPDSIDEQYRSMTLEVAALDREGNKVINVVIYPETVSFRAAAGSTKEVRLVVPVKNESEDSYERTYTVPETIVIKGKKSTIDAFTGITAKEIDLANYYEDGEIPIEFELPEGVTIDEEQDPYMLKLKVVEKEEEEEEEEGA